MMGLRLFALAMASQCHSASSLAIKGVVRGRCMWKLRTHWLPWSLKNLPIPPFPGLAKAEPSMLSFRRPLGEGYHLLLVMVLLGIWARWLLIKREYSLAREIASWADTWSFLLLKLLLFLLRQMVQRQWRKRITQVSQLSKGFPLSFYNDISQLVSDKVDQIWLGLKWVFWKISAQKRVALGHLKKMWLMVSSWSWNIWQWGRGDEETNVVQVSISG